MGDRLEQAQVGSIASAERVFAVLTDWPRHREWMPFTRAVGGTGVGAVVEGWTGVGPVGFLDTMTITEWVPGRRVGVRHTGRFVRGEGWFTVTPLDGGGCVIGWEEKLSPPPLEPLWPLAAPAFRGFMKVALRRLAGLAERG